MDFQLDEDQKALSELAGRILAEQSTEARVKAVEAEAAAGGDGVDRKLWADLAAAGLLAAPFAEENGGAGVGFVGAGVVLEEIGRRVAAVPYLETVALSGLAVERFGNEALRLCLPRIADGSLLVAPALTEVQGDPRVPSTKAVATAAGSLVIDGEKICVGAGLAAGAFLVPAVLDDATNCVVFVEAGADGLSVERQDTTTGRPEAFLCLDGVEVAESSVLGTTAERGEVLDWIIDRATAGICVMLAGSLEEAVRITANYVKERKQFERPLATFQAVGQRAADAYIDTLGVRLTAWQAVWRLSVGLPASDEVTIAKYWASEAGQRVVHACQHLHGGVGMDRDYPVHRYFLQAKRADLALGGAAPQLAELGRRMAARA